MVRIAAPRLPSRPARLLALGSRTALVTSPGFGKAFALNLAGLGALLALAASYPPAADAGVRALERFQLLTLRTAHQLAWWTAISLLSSSCCALQLLLNLISMGCAGFNTVLGPLRPTLLALQLGAQGWMWHVALRNQPWQIPVAAASTALASILTFLPELLDALSRHRLARLERGGAPAALPCFEVALTLPTIGCVACREKITATLAAHELAPRMRKVEVDVDSKQARITLQDSPAAAQPDLATERAEAAAALSAALHAAGFPSSGLELRAAAAAASGQEAAGGAGASGALRLRGGGAGGAGLPARLWHAGAYVLGLLASSCCLLQLALNTLAVGCAGFNTVLGPWRPHLRALTAVWLSAMWAPALRAKRLPGRSVLASTSASIVLTLLPEILRASGGPALAPPTSNTVALRLQLDGMGCEACEVAVSQILTSAGGVIDARARFESGVAELRVANDWAFNLSDVQHRLGEAGFDVLHVDGDDGAGPGSRADRADSQPAAASAADASSGANAADASSSSAARSSYG